MLIHRQLQNLSFQNRLKRSGFALISTVLIMSLLALIALGLLSLSSVQTRTSQSTAAMDKARANAKLALNIAISRLQTEMGPDRRISSSAAILDDSPETEVIDGVTQPRYLGVWDSWDTWLNDPKTMRDGSTIQISDTYKSGQRGRHPGLFRRWLVSGLDSDTAQMEFATDGTASSQPMARLVGTFDAGTTLNGIVEAPIVSIGESTQTPGGYAWWVGDQSQKARVNIQGRKTIAGLQASQAAANTLGRPPLEGLDTFQAVDTSPSQIEKWLDQATLYAAARTAPDQAKPLPFHSVATSGIGLMTDVRFGGMKKDLNTAFENATIPSEFGQSEVFGINFDTPVRPMKGELAKIDPANPYVAPLSWRQMHQYYRMYRDFTGNRRGRYLKWSAGSPMSKQFMMGVQDLTGQRRGYKIPDSMGYARQLVLLRLYWIMCLRTESAGTTKKYFFNAIPVIHMWNPYNVPLTVDSDGGVLSGGNYFTAGLHHAANLKLSIYGGTSTKTINLSQAMGGYSDSFGKVNTTTTFKPGEVRIFSLAGVRKFNSVAGSASQEFDTAPGYIPVADGNVSRGLEFEIPNFAPENAPSIAISFTTYNARNTPAYFNGNDAASLSTWLGQQRSSEFGALNESEMPMSPNAQFNYGVTSIAWLGNGVGSPDERTTEIIKDTALDRAQWPASDGLKAIGLLGFTAKDPDGLHFENTNTGYAADYRMKTWLHSTPTRSSNYLINPQAVNRAASPFQMFFIPATANSVSNYIQSDGDNAFYGGSFGASGSSNVVALELPTSPITNLAGFAGMKMDHARALETQQDTRIPNAPNDTGNLGYKHVAHSGGDFGSGVGNAYASPLIPGDKIYNNIPFGADKGHEQSGGYRATNFDVFSDYWDQLFLTNEGLWDSYFMSSIVPESTSGNVDKALDEVAKAFFAGTESLPNANYIPLKQGKSAEDLAALAEQPDGWKSIGSHIGINGAFNVNSTSVEAWTMFLNTMKDREIPYLDATDGTTTGTVSSADDIVVSRFRLANGDKDGSDPLSQEAWSDVRFLNDHQIKRLATEMVKQVKLRGPFLNMSDFINRRLSNDRLGVTGALQAAIDWDEFDAGYDGTASNDAVSINRGFKQGSDMIDTPNAPFPNQLAAKGSRFAGAPGYVMQSDLLQGIGSSLVVRGDTFKIRAYGEVRDSSGTKVIARAWCEAIVQRTPEYMDATNSPETPAKKQDGTDNSELTDINRRFGRKMEIVSFRWLTPSEIEN